MMTEAQVEAMLHIMLVAQRNENILQDMLAKV